MVKMYILAGVLSTYATLNKVYKAGVEYTAEQVGKDKDSVDEQGESFFEEVEVEVAEGETKPTTRTVFKVGKKAQHDESGAQADAASSEGGTDGKVTI